MPDPIFIYKIGQKISLFAGFIPLFVGLLFFKKVSKHFLSLFILSVIGATIDQIINSMNSRGVNNIPFFHYFTVIEFTLLSLFYYSFFKKYFDARIILLIMVAFYGVAYVDSRINGLEVMNRMSTTVECVLLICYSLFLYYYVLKHLLYEDLLAEPVFWINTAVLVYFAGNMLLFIFSIDLVKLGTKKHYALWSIIHSLFNAIYNILISIGFWKVKDK